MIGIIDAVIVAASFLLGVLTGGEAQKRILRGHEGTRSEKLRELQRQRADHVRRRQIDLYGTPPRTVPEPHPAPDNGDRWWRRHPSGESPIRRSP